MNEEDENDLIKGYYFQGFEYKDILRVLYQYHGISISKSTLQLLHDSYYHVFTTLYILHIICYTLYHSLLIYYIIFTLC